MIHYGRNINRINIFFKSFLVEESLYSQYAKKAFSKTEEKNCRQIFFAGSCIIGGSYSSFCGNAFIWRIL